MKRLLLLGGGHAHVNVLASLAQNRMADVEVTLVSPYSRQVYSGMLPGWVAGHYAIDDCIIPLAPLAMRAKVRFVEAQASGLDLHANCAHVVDAAGSRSTIDFDIVSIDTGPVANTDLIPGAAAHAISIRPIESFIVAVQATKGTIDARHRAGMNTRLVFVGAGAGGIELAMAFHHAATDKQTSVGLISAANTLPGNVGPRLANALKMQGITLLAGKSAARIDADGVHLVSGECVPADIVIAATGAAAAPWPRAAGLACDPQGFILTNAFLQSVSHPQVFAAGDCATMAAHARPKSGVYAVRAGPPLEANLRRALSSMPLISYQPQARSLYLISLGAKRAIASWGPLVISGAWIEQWLWRWKDRIDRSFIAKYR